MDYNFDINQKLLYVYHCFYSWKHVFNDRHLQSLDENFVALFPFGMKLVSEVIETREKSPLILFCARACSVAELCWSKSSHFFSMFICGTQRKSCEFSFSGFRVGDVHWHSYRSQCHDIVGEIIIDKNQSCRIGWFQVRGI